MLLFSRQLGQRLRGVAEADTVVMDPHKILGLNQGLGMLFVRDKTLLTELGKRALPYFSSGPVPELCAKTLDGTRGLNSLGAWLLLRTLGRDGYGQIVEYLSALASSFAQQLAATGRFEVVKPAGDLNIVGFRLLSRSANAPSSSGRDERLLARLNEEGHFAISKHRPESGPCLLRAVFVNPATRTEDVRAFVARLVELARLDV